MKPSKNKLLHYFLIYTLCFLGIAAVIICLFVSRGKSFISYTDGIAQHFPALCYTRKYLRTLFTSGNLPLIDLSIGQGFDIIGTLNYYGFGDPLNLITLLFPNGMEEFMYAFMIFLRLYLTGISFSVYVFHIIKKREIPHILTGALLYTFCNFALFAGFKHPFFLNGTLYLPLLLTGIERILQKKKCTFFTLIVGLAFMSNYYFMYKNTLLIAVYYLIRNIDSYRLLGVKGFTRLTLKIIGAYIRGTCLSAFILLPSVFSFLQNSRAGSTADSFSLVYSLDYYMKLLPRITEPSIGGNHWSIPGTGALALIPALMLFVRHDKKHKRLIIGFVTLVLMLCFPFIGSVMNGFSYSANRWAYAFAFLLALTCIFELPYLKELNSQQSFRIIGLLTLYSAALGLGSILFRNDDGNILSSTLAVSLGMLMFFIGHRLAAQYFPSKNFSAAITFFTIVTLLWNVRGLYHEDTLDFADTFVDSGAAVSRLTNTPLKALSSVKDDSLYRTENHWDLYNNSLYTGDFTTSFYYSVIPRYMDELYSSLWLNSHNCRNTLNSLDSRFALTSLASVKYFVNNSDRSVPYQYQQKGSSYLYENPLFLPLGYTYDSFMLRSDYEKYSPLERERILLENAVIDAPAPNIQESGSFDKTIITASDITVSAAKDASFEDGILSGKKGGQITLHFDGKADCETYLVISNPKLITGGKQMNTLKISSAASDTRLQFYHKTHDFYMPQDGVIANLGYTKDGITECTITFAQKSKYSIDGMEIQYASMDKAETAVRERKEESLTDIQMTANQISGKITATTPKILQFSIPYDKGWTVYVDGKQTKTFVSDLAYTGIYLEAGEHDVVLKYMSRGFIPGIWISVTALIGVIVYSFRRIRPYKKSKA